MDTLLIDRRAAPALLPRLARSLASHSVQFRADPASLALLQAAGIPQAQPATEQHFHTEYNDYVANLALVDGVDGAIAHIARFGSAHSDSIVTGNATTAQRFLAGVDSAAVYWNASTRFTDGGEFGMGAEIGISTDKIGARGPMGLEELTSYKWLGLGTGQVRT
jgi:glutamate-5-semialdehyde dehydrogenase